MINKTDSFKGCWPPGYLRAEATYCKEESTAFYTCEDLVEKERLRQICLNKRNEFYDVWMQEQRGN